MKINLTPDLNCPSCAQKIQWMRVGLVSRFFSRVRFRCPECGVMLETKVKKRKSSGILFLLFTVLFFAAAIYRPSFFPAALIVFLLALFGLAKRSVRYEVRQMIGVDDHGPISHAFFCMVYPQMNCPACKRSVSWEKIKTMKRSILKAFVPLECPYCFEWFKLKPTALTDLVSLLYFFMAAGTIYYLGKQGHDWLFFPPALFLFALPLILIFRWGRYKFISLDKA